MLCIIVCIYADISKLNEIIKIKAHVYVLSILCMFDLSITTCCFEDVGHQKQLKIFVPLQCIL